MIKKYKELSAMKKVGFWGSFASIVGLAIGVYSMQAVSNNQEINGNKNNVINQNNGTININQGGDSSGTGKTYILKNQSSGAVLVVSKPEVTAAANKASHVCMVPAGTEIMLTGEKASHAGVDMWRQVKITSGECTGRTGWAAIENISYQ